MLYHGTILEGLKWIKANSKSHTSGKPVAYFSEDRVYALVCCRSPHQNFVTMGPREDGKQHYYERFPNQLETLYQGQKGFLYLPDSSADTLKRTRDHTWESECDVPIQQCEIIDDVYSEIMNEEAKGNVVVHRYAEISPEEQKMHANYIKAHLHEKSDEMRAFYIRYFSSLWD